MMKKREAAGERRKVKGQRIKVKGKRRKGRRKPVAFLRARHVRRRRPGIIADSSVETRTAFICTPRTDINAALGLLDGPLESETSPVSLTEDAWPSTREQHRATA